MTARRRPELHVSLGLDPGTGEVLSAAIMEPGGTDPAWFGRMSTFVVSTAGGEGEVFARLWAAIMAMPARRVVLRSAAQLEALRGLQVRHPDVCPPIEMLARLNEGRLLQLEADLIRPLVPADRREPDVLAVAMAFGVALRPEDLDDEVLTGLHASVRSTGVGQARLALAKRHRRLCEASLVVLDLLAGALAAFQDDGGDPPNGDGGPGRGRVPDDDPADGVWFAPGVGGENDGDAGSDTPGGGEDGTWRVHAMADGGSAEVPSANLSPGSDGSSIDAPVARLAAPAVHQEAPSLLVARTAFEEPPHHEELRCFRVLQRPLPLVGAAAFARTADGGFSLPARLRLAAPWMEAAIQAVEAAMRVAWWSGRPWLAWRPMLLVGDPGAGKSHFARALAAAARVPLSAVDLGTASDALGVAGVARGWASTMPAWPLRAMTEHRVANPLLVGDELDKSGGHRGSGGGTVHDALLAMLEPSTATAFRDRCLDVELDLSACLWLFTANGLDGMARPLLSRLDVIEVGRPGPEHFDALRAGVEIGLAERWGVPPASVPELPASVVDALRSMFERHRSARRLQADLARLLATIVPDGPEVLH